MRGGFSLHDELRNIDRLGFGDALQGVEALAKRLLFLFGLLRELFPCRALLGFLAGAFFGGLAGAGVFFRLQPRLFRGRLGCQQILPQPLQLGADRSGGVRRRARRLKGAGDKRRIVAKGPVKPDAGLPRIFEGVERFGERSLRAMRSGIAKDAQAMKEVGNLGRHNPFKAEPAQQIGLRFVARLVEAGLGGDELREQFAELAKLDQACVGIVMKIAFGKGSQPHELSVVRFKEAKIAGLNLHDRIVTPD